MPAADLASNQLNIFNKLAKSFVYGSPQDYPLALQAVRTITAGGSIDNIIVKLQGIHKDVDKRNYALNKALSDALKILKKLNNKGITKLPEENIQQIAPGALIKSLEQIGKQLNSYNFLTHNRAGKEELIFKAWKTICTTGLVPSVNKDSSGNKTLVIPLKDMGNTTPHPVPTGEYVKPEVDDRAVVGTKPFPSPSRVR